MKFRTEITPTPLRHPIDHRDQLLSLGSCFAEQMAERLRRAAFRITCNPTGSLFNPESIAQLIERLESGAPLNSAELRAGEEGWFHDDFRGSFSGSDPIAVVDGMNRALEKGREALQNASCVMITFGTAWVYEREGRVVANCHKQPGNQFTRHLLSIDEIVQRWSSLLSGALRDKRLLITLSPVRHLRDRAEENSLSKAILRVAIEELCHQFDTIEYFPSYELMIDDLRDYRFYAADLTHPSEEGVTYVWERLCDAAFTPETRQLMAKAEALYRARNHRSLHPDSPADRHFRKETEQAIRDFEASTGLKIE